MKQHYVLVLLSLSLMWFQSSPAWAAVNMQHSVNAVIGDRSYVARFGEAPSPQTSEKLRIQTHLAYVETQLRESTPLVISPALYTRRQALLNHLQTYWQQGVFPTQTGYAGRRPHFIDEQGRLCAVGYLVAQTAGLELAQQINRRYRYAYLPDMKMPELQSWVGQSGLTLKELAMIQPTYGGMSGGGSVSQPVSRNISEVISIQTWITSTLILTALLIPQLLLVAVDSTEYQKIETLHQNTSFIVLGLYALLSIFAFGSKNYDYQPNSYVQQFILTGAGISLLPIVAHLLTMLLVDTVHAPKEAIAVSLGSFKLADGTSASGFYSSFQF